MAHIRSFQPGDESALAEVCLRTANLGGDGTGMLRDDRLFSDVAVLPELASVVASDDGRAIGYVVGTPDTAAFNAWFAREWWPRMNGRYSLQGANKMEQALLGWPAAATRRTCPSRISIPPICISIYNQWHKARALDACSSSGSPCS